MKKPKAETQVDESSKIDLVTQKEMDAFALFEELQKGALSFLFFCAKLRLSINLYLQTQLKWRERKH